MRASRTVVQVSRALQGSWAKEQVGPLAVLALGIWLVILHPLGPGLSLLPGTLADTRYNNYMLEHFSRWVAGLDSSFWTADFFYPYRWTTAFSVNLLGSAPVYALLRRMGYDQYTSLQLWYTIGCVANYCASAWVLRRFRLSPLSVSIGAFFFSFGLPALAQEMHLQMAYRFCVPLACYFLWQFFQKPRVWDLVMLVSFVVWQFYLEIYTGIFLAMLLAALVLIAPFFDTPSGRSLTAAWAPRFRDAWREASRTEKVLGVLIPAIALVLLLALLFPYYMAYHLYGFARAPADIAVFMPRPWSYLIADHSQIWSFLGRIFPSVAERQEHQLFPGATVICLVIIGLALRLPRGEGSRVARLYLLSAAALVLLTLVVHGYSLYEVLWWIPGLNGIRAVGRIELVVMWPLASYAAFVLDGLQTAMANSPVLRKAPLYGLAMLLVMESVLYNHTTFSKADAASRIAELRSQLPPVFPQSPVLFLAEDTPTQETILRELDAMVLAQELGWPTLNGYSGNFPAGYELPDHCLGIPDAVARIQGYSRYGRGENMQLAQDALGRIVLVNDPSCAASGMPAGQP